MARRDRSTVPVIHAVTTDDIAAQQDFLRKAREVMEALGARGCVHLRTSRMNGARLFELAAALADAQQATESWLVVNDRLDIALSAGARAVQLTSRSIALREAVPIARPMAVGASVHSVEEARNAERDEADWIVAGHVFDTDSHAGDPARGERFIAELAWSVAAPIIAIGGILPQHVSGLRNAGAHGVAAIRGIWAHSNAGLAAADYLSKYDADADRR